MDNAVILQQFEEIENKIEELIHACKAHEATIFELKEKNERLDHELQVKIEAENIYTEEKDLVRSKIDGLLDKLDKITET